MKTPIDIRNSPEWRSSRSTVPNESTFSGTASGSPDTSGSRSRDRFGGTSGSRCQCQSRLLHSGKGGATQMSKLFLDFILIICENLHIRGPVRAVKAQCKLQSVPNEPAFSGIPSGSRRVTSRVASFGTSHNKFLISYLCYRR